MIVLIPSSVIYSIYNESGKNNNGEKTVSSISGTGESGIVMTKLKILFHTIYKNKFNELKT